MNKNTSQYDRLIHTPIPRLVIEMGIPGIVSMMITTVYNMVDTWFVAQLGTQAVAACGVTFSIMELMMSLGYLFGTGGGTAIGLLLGAKKSEEANRIGSTAFAITIALGSAIAALGILFISPIMRFLGASEQVLPYAIDYGLFILLGFPVMSGSLVLSTVLRFEGKMKLATLGIASGGILNMILDPIFIFGFHMGITGAALATFLSQLAGFLLLASFYARGMTEVKLRLRNVALRAEVLRRILVTGLPSLTRHGVATLSNTAMNIAAGMYGGDVMIASLSIVSKVMSLLMAVIKGLSQGSTTIFSYNRGAGRFDRVKKTFGISLAMMMGIAAAFIAIFVPLSGGVIRCFNAADAQVVSVGTRAFRMQLLTLLVMPVGFMANQLLQAVGEPMKSTFLAALPQGVFYIPAVFLLPLILGANGVLLAPMLGYTLTAIVAVPVVRGYFAGMEKIV